MMRHNTTKTALLLLLLLLAADSLQAAPRTAERARLAAQRQMNRRLERRTDGQKGAAAAEPQLVFSKPRQQAAAQGEAYYHVFSAGRNQGYTIVSGDDRLPAIVGYTEEGDYDAARLPENLASFLQAYEDMVDRATDEQVEEIKAWQARRAAHAPVAPFVKAKWDQGEPYNNLCPRYNGADRAVTGCTATAVAQILHYWKCPETLQADIPAYTAYSYNIWMPAIAAGERYDWDNMADTYGTTATAAQQDAVAKLMLHVGCAVEMNYGPSSGANAYAETFTKYFGMDKDLARDLDRAAHQIDEWDEILYAEMAARRPVFYDGFSMGGGHAFVVNGYDDGLYYVNWGWGGYSNGYFDITILNPNNTTGAGASSTSDGYSRNNGMIIGIQPDNGVADDVPPEPAFLSVSNLYVGYVDSDRQPHQGTWSSVTTSSISGTVIAAVQNHHLQGETYVAIGLAEGDAASVTPVSWNYAIDEELLPPGYYYPHLEFDCDFTYRENVVYKLMLVESTDGTNWTPSYGAETTALTFYVEDRQVKYLTHELSATVAADTGTGNGYAGMTNTINVTVSNGGEKEYYDVVYVMVSRSATMPSGYTFAAGITAPVGGSTTLNFAYTPPTAGTYNFWVLDASGSQIGRSSINFETAEPPLLSFVAITCNSASGDKVVADCGGDIEMDAVYDTQADFTFEVRNDGGYYSGQFYLYQYTPDDGMWRGYAHTLVFPANSTTTYTFTAEGSAGEVTGLRMQGKSVDIEGLPQSQWYKHYYYENGNKTTRYRYYTDGEICYLAGPQGGDTAVGTVSATDNEQGDWYTLSGVKVEKPTKGIYVKNGKKHVFK